MRTLVTVLVGLLPAGRGKNRLLRMAGHAVAPTAYVGPSLLLRVGRLDIGDRAHVGPFNVIRDVVRVELKEHAVLAQWNWVSAARLLTLAGSDSTFTIGRHSAVTSRHYIDASGGIEIGDFSTVAGVRSTFVTHGIRWSDSTQRFAPIRIGNHCIIGSNASITPGTTVPDGVVVGMGATLSGTLDTDHALYVQPRATRVKSGLTGAYFRRLEGRVDPAPPPVAHNSE